MPLSSPTACSLVMPISIGFAIGPPACSFRSAARPSQNWAVLKTAFSTVGALRPPSCQLWPIEVGQHVDAAQADLVAGVAADVVALGEPRLEVECLAQLDHRGRRRNVLDRRRLLGIGWKRPCASFINGSSAALAGAMPTMSSITAGKSAGTRVGGSYTNVLFRRGSVTGPAIEFYKVAHRMRLNAAGGRLGAGASSKFTPSVDRSLLPNDWSISLAAGNTTPRAWGPGLGSSSSLRPARRWSPPISLSCCAGCRLRKKMPECHAVQAGEKVSPDPAAPRVANSSGMTGLALVVWLQSSHPTMPNLMVPPDNVVAYIMGQTPRCRANGSDAGQEKAESLRANAAV